MDEVIGIIEEVVFRNEDNGFTVMEIRSEAEGTTVTVVGNLPFAVEGERVKVTGQWTVHPDYGEQLKVKPMRQHLLPARRAWKYLASGS